MSLWIGNKEVGLSPGQTSGEVGGEYIERPASVSTTGAYIPGRRITEVKVERDVSGKPTRFNLYRYDQYGNLMSIGEQRAGRGNPIITTPPSRFTQEQAERFNLFEQKEYQQDVRLAYERQQQTAARRQAGQQVSSMDRMRQQFGQGEIRRSPTFQLPIFKQYQDRYQPPPKRYYAVSYFGENVAHEYKKGEKFKTFGIFPSKEPRPGMQYKSDILGNVREYGELGAAKEESIRSSMERGALEGVSTTDIKLRQLGNLLAVSPFIIKYPYLKPSVSISKGKPPLEKMFGSKTFVSQKKAFGGQTYYVEPKPATQQIKVPILNKMFGGTAKPTIKVDVLKNMFGSTAYQKPRKTTVMDILLVQPQRQRQIVRPVESMWRQVFAKPSEIKPMIDYEAIYQQQAVRNILQYTKLSKVAKPTPQITVAKPVKTYGVMEYLRSKQQYRYSPQQFKPALKTISGTQYKFILGMGASSNLLSGLMQGQRQNQLLGQLLGQQQAQAQRQTFKQRFSYDFSFKYPTFTKTGIPEIRTSLQPQQPVRTPTRQPPKTPPPRQPTKEPPLFRIPKKPFIYMPSFEMPAIFDQGRRRRYKTKEKTIVTRMLSLKDILRNI